MVQKYPSLKKFDDMGDDYVEFGDGREARVFSYFQSHPSFQSLRGNPAKILALMDEFSAQEDFLISIGPNKQQILDDIITTKKPTVLVELGGYIGYSAILFADAMSRTGVQDPVVWSLEASQEYADIANKFVDLAGLSHMVKIIVGPAEQSLRQLQADGVWSKGIDVLFLDHVEDLYEHDLKVCEKLDLLRPGTVVLADNALRPGAPDYVKYVRAHPRLDSHGIKSLIIPGELEDEIEYTVVK
ncbi:hypothetical protein N0V93_003144 [Gnomoniopsis smithogilvyi]|uniref:catechol O-methyltransferase n=1 Tax=Gnomoniopsis smithogilvyi TaxID=1191159 RepID=A0A9W9CZL4_9PEZI|nr:hypothetical protein N0V93_003144 [Gnomoniopsis smithogilvyi]